MLVEHDLLEQRLRDPLAEPAVHLPLDDHRVQHAAAVVDRHVFEQVDLARIDVDLDGRHVGAERERQLLLEASGARGQRSAGPPPRSLHAIADAGDPATPSPPSVGTMSSGDASRNAEASSRARSRTSPAASNSDDPPICSAATRTPSPRSTAAVSEWTT